jgi:hypothetical protein
MPIMAITTSNSTRVKADRIPRDFMAVHPLEREKKGDESDGNRH